jgi:hypothetical protein
VRFWYRESPTLLERRGGFENADNATRVLSNEPPLFYSGEVRVWLDRDGRLVDFTAVPSQRNNRAAPAADADWPALFRAAGLDSASWIPAPPLWTPQFFADRQVAWVPRDDRP